MPRIGERGWFHSGVKVVDNAAAPTSWADLDLSSVVGKNRALVFLKLKNKNASHMEHYDLRHNGDTEEVGNSMSYPASISQGVVDEGAIIHFMVVTDVNGLMEWKSTNGYDTDIWVIGYIR